MSATGWDMALKTISPGRLPIFMKGIHGAMRTQDRAASAVSVRLLIKVRRSAAKSKISIA
ncbi:hypothetical protein D3C72_2016070 [compost metagenome]